MATEPETNVSDQQAAITASIAKNRDTQSGLERALRKGVPYAGAKFFLDDGGLYFGWMRKRREGGHTGNWVEVCRIDMDETPGQRSAMRRILRLLKADLAAKGA